ncbi:Sec-independent protein translocase protein TatB [Rhodobacteraceae bacterium NNCM2]|nr:Sec-independent protein translocase protein TatB [Coraliihabitans acroporae]
MLDIGWQELLVIGALALIVVGPKDLPGLLRTLGQYVNKIRGMAREFQRTMDDAARESDIGNLKELRDLQKDIRSATKFDFKDQAKRASDSLTNPPKPVDSLAEFDKVKKTPEPEAEAAPAPDDAPKATPEPAAKPVPEPATKPAPETDKTAAAPAAAEAATETPKV